MSIEIYKMGLSVSKQASQKLERMANEECNAQVDLMFGRLHEGRIFGEDEEAQDYNKNDYQRVGFEHSYQAEQFVQYMQEQGYEAVAAPVKINGQYLAEVNKTPVSMQGQGTQHSNNHSPNSNSLSSDNHFPSNSAPTPPEQHLTPDTPFEDINSQNDASPVSMQAEAPQNMYEKQVQDNFVQNNAQGAYQPQTEVLNGSDSALAYPDTEPNSEAGTYNYSSDYGENNGNEPTETSRNDYIVPAGKNDYTANGFSGSYDFPSANSGNVQSGAGSGENAGDSIFGQNKDTSFIIKEKDSFNSGGDGGNGSTTPPSGGNVPLYNPSTPNSVPNNNLQDYSHGNSLEECIVLFQAQTGYDVQDAKKHEEKPVTENVMDRELSSLNNFLVGNMDFLGRAISDVSYYSHKAERYDDLSRNRSYFDNGGKLDMRSAHTKTAIVVGNHVIVDGKEVTSERAREFVLKQHQKRQEKAASLVNKHTTEELYDIKSSERREEHARKEEERRAKFDKKEDKRLQKHLDEGKNASTFKPKEFKNKEFKEKSVVVKNTVSFLSKKENDKIIKRREAAEKMQNNLYGRQEYVALKAENGAMRKAGVLDDFKNAFNTEALVLSSATLVAFELSQRERELIKKFSKYMTADQQDILSGILVGADVGVLQEKEALHEFAEALKDKVDDSDKEVLKALCDKTLFTKDELSMLTNFNDLAKSLKNDLGVDLLNGNVSRGQLIRLNDILIDRSELAGIQLVKGNGKFDMEVFKNLSDSQLKALGISKETQKFFEEFNKEGAWGTFDGSGLLVIGGFAFRKVVKGLDDDDTKKLVSGARQTFRYSKDTIKTTKNFATSVRSHIEAVKAKKVGRSKTKGGANLSSSTPQKTIAKKAGQVNKAANEKFKAANKTRAAKLFKSEKGIISKVGHAKNAVMSKVMNMKVVQVASAVKAKVAAAIASVLPYVALFVLFLILGMAAAFIIIIVIASFLNAKTYQETVCYILAKELAKNETEWVEGLNDADNLYTKRSEMGYGTDNIAFADYVAKFDNLVLDEAGNLYVNPFKNIPEVTPDNPDTSCYLSSMAGGYNGALTSSISANKNQYGEKLKADDADENLFVSTESGHTSNIKDIIAMIDVMYGCETDEADDDGLDEVLTSTPAKLDWDNFWGKVGGFFNWIGTNIASWFSPDKEGISWSEAMNKTGVSYDTVLNYAMHLFFASHSSQNDFTVSFLPKGYIVDPTVMGTQPLPLSTNVYAEIGYCNDTVNCGDKRFYIAWIDNHVAIVMKLGVNKDEETGEVNPIFCDMCHTDTGDVHIDMSKYNAHSDEIDYKNQICLTTVMGDDEATYSFVKGQSQLGLTGEGACWKRADDIVQEIPLTGDGDDWSASAAESAAISNLNSKFSSWEEPDKEYYLSGTPTNPRTNFKYVYYTKLGSVSNISTISVVPREVQVTVPTFDENGKPNGTTTVTRTRYHVVVKGTVATKTTEVYNRNCNGHPFTYCSGHVNVNVQGNVLSITNEQIIGVEACEDDMFVPTVEDFDMEGYGYLPVMGKHDLTNKDNWSTVYAAAHSGCGTSPTVSIQGSYPAMRGVNYYCDETTKGWAEGFMYREDSDGIQAKYLRDIFDADCAVDKGSNIFNFNESSWQDYDGWSEDNVTLAVAKYSVDWADVYEFNIPSEMDSLTLNQEDVENIIKSLKANPNYSACFATAEEDGISEREQAVKNILAMVGRGHYSANHTDHSFLADICKAKTQYATKDKNGNINTLTYDVNCTASNMEGFIKYILYKGEKLTNPSDEITGWQAYSGINSLLPADILKHNGSGTLPSDFTTADKGYLQNAKSADLIESYFEDSYAFFIGNLGEDVTLKNGIVLSAGTTLTVTLAENENIGSIRLCTVDATSWFDLDKGEVTVVTPPPDELTPEIKEDYPTYKNYYWIKNPDAGVEVKKYN